MKLRSLTLQKIDSYYSSRKQLLRDLNTLMCRVDERDKIHLINTYICFSNLFHIESNYAELVFEHHDCIIDVIDCLERNSRKCGCNSQRNDCVIIAFVNVLQFNLDYVKDNKVRKLIA